MAQLEAKFSVSLRISSHFQFLNQYVVAHLADKKNIPDKKLIYCLESFFWYQIKRHMHHVHSIVFSRHNKSNVYPVCGKLQINYVEYGNQHDRLHDIE